MIGDRRIVALVPMKSESERVPGKNMRPFGGRPLFAHIIGTLFEIAEIDEVVVDTDSRELASMVVAEFPTVRIVERPDDLIGHMVPMNDIIRYDIEQVPADLYLQTHSTNPLLTVESVRRALRLMVEHDADFDSVFSVTPLYSRFWTKDLTPVNHNPEILTRTQDLEPLYEENSCLYVFPPSTIRKYGRRIGETPLMIPLERAESLDIDEEIDFAIAESVYLRGRA